MKFKYLSIPFLSSTLLFSAYASIQSDLRNLIQETTKQDVDVYKVIKTSEGRKNLITSLKKSYEVNPDKTTKLLLDAWKQSAEKGEIDIEKINFPDVGIYATGNDPLKIELKVEYFDMEYQDLNNFSINAKLNY
ncbi:lipoprotein, partial [Mycoplasmoides pneumoniae]